MGLGDVGSRSVGLGEGGVVLPFGAYANLDALGDVRKPLIMPAEFVGDLLEVCVEEEKTISVPSSSEYSFIVYSRRRGFC